MMIEDYKTVEASLKCLYTKEHVDAAIGKISQQLNADLTEQDPIFLCVPNGGIVFLGQLLTQLHFPLQIDTIHVTRYRGETQGDDIHWQSKPSIDLKDRVVVIVDDILDQGITLKAIVEYCQQQGAKKILTAVLLNKTDARVTEGLAHADYVGLAVENSYLVGYGMDYKDYFRNLAGIYKI